MTEQESKARQCCVFVFVVAVVFVAVVVVVDHEWGAVHACVCVVAQTAVPVQITDSQDPTKVVAAGYCC